MLNFLFLISVFVVPKPRIQRARKNNHSCGFGGRSWQLAILHPHMGESLVGYVEYMIQMVERSGLTTVWYTIRT